MPADAAHGPHASDTAGSPRRVPVRREGVDERVRGRVVRLPGAAEQAGGRGEQHERGEVGVPGQLVEVHGGVDLGPQHLVQPLRGPAEPTTPSSSTPAVCTTARSGCSAGIPASNAANGVAVGDVAAATVTVAPSPVSSSRSSAAPSAAGRGGWPAAGAARRAR